MNMGLLNKSKYLILGNIVKKLTSYFINNGFLVNLISAMMIIAGVISIFHMKRDLISAWSSNTISVSTSLSGAGPSQMEKFVTYPIEQSIKNLPGIERINSESSQGWMNIRVRVKDDYKDVQELVQKIKDNVANLKSSLPSEVEEVNVNHRKMTESWFSSYAMLGFDENNEAHQNWLTKFKERFSHIDGVSRISDSARTKQLYIKLDPDALARYRLNTSLVFRKVIESFTLYPIGSIKKGADDILVEIENKELVYETVKNIVVKANTSGHQLRLGEIATIERKLPERTVRHYTNGIETIWITIFKDIATDSLILKSKVEKFVERESKEAPKGITFKLTGDGPSFIERQINALNSNSVFGVLLVVLTLMVFLGFKNSLMTSFGIPLSYCFTFFVLDTMGISIDLISVVGMLLVLGILVDDAIIISEQYSQELESGLPPKQAAQNAVLKTWIPITGTVLTTIVAFSPILFGHDQLSKIMMAIPIVVFAALGVSLFESFFILPNHLAHFVKKPQKENKLKFINTLRGYYRKVLGVSLKLRYLVIPLFIGFMGFSIYFAQKNIPMNFNLNINSEKINFLAILKESQSIEETEKKIAGVYKELEGLDKKRFNYLNVRIGRVWNNGKEIEGPHAVSFKIYFSQLDENVEANKKYVENFLKERLPKLKKTGLFEKLEVKRRFDGHDDAKDSMVEVRVSSLAPFDVETVKNKFKSDLKPIKGINSIDLEDSKFVDSWTFVPNKSQILSHGLTLAEVSRQLRGYVSKSKIYEYKAGPEILKIYSYFEEGKNQTRESLSQKPIILSNGNKVTTGQLGNWIVKKKLKSISHNNLKRSITVEIPFDEKIIKKAALIKEVKKVVENYKTAFPALEFNAQDADEQSRKNKKSIGKKFIYSLMGIFFVLAVILRSIAQPLLICSAIPFGIIGVIWAFYFQGLKLDVMAFIGIIGMAGVVVNDSLILVDTVNKMKTTWKNFTKDIVIEGATSRLRPILLTSITTLGGVFPMAYGLGGDSGFTKPLAMSMGWGLLFATTLTLFAIPCMLMIQADFMKLIGRFIKEKPKAQELAIEEEMPSADELIYAQKKPEISNDFIQ
jgi:multidrug efflux pump subunit AcrB